MGNHRNYYDFFYLKKTNVMHPTVHVVQHPSPSHHSSLSLSVSTSKESTHKKILQFYFKGTMSWDCTPFYKVTLWNIYNEIETIFTNFCSIPTIRCYLVTLSFWVLRRIFFKDQFCIQYIPVVITLWILSIKSSIAYKKVVMYNIALPWSKFQTFLLHLSPYRYI